MHHTLAATSVITTKMDYFGFFVIYCNCVRDDKWMNGVIAVRSKSAGMNLLAGNGDDRATIIVENSFDEFNHLLSNCTFCVVKISEDFSFIFRWIQNWLSLHCTLSSCLWFRFFFFFFFCLTATRNSLLSLSPPIDIFIECRFFSTFIPTLSRRAYDFRLYAVGVRYTLACRRCVDFFRIMEKMQYLILILASLNYFAGILWQMTRKMNKCENKQSRIWMQLNVTYYVLHPPNEFVRKGRWQMWWRWRIRINAEVRKRRANRIGWLEIEKSVNSRLNGDVIWNMRCIWLQAAAYINTEANYTDAGNPNEIPSVDLPNTGEAKISHQTIVHTEPNACLIHRIQTMESICHRPC